MECTRQTAPLFPNPSIGSRHPSGEPRTSGIIAFMPRIALVLTLFCSLAMIPACGCRLATDAPPPNILLICIDDLRPELACANGLALTPNLDAFSATARRFDRHYVAVPTCGASRAALLTGLLPSKGAHLSNGAVRTRTQDGDQSWVSALRQAGYHTMTLGKIEHWPAEESSELKSAESKAWSEHLIFESEPWGSNRDAFFAYADGSVRIRGQSPISEFPEVDDDAYPDARIATAAIQALERSARGNKPFLLAVGFYKPHLPFNAPARYRSLYDDIDIPDAPNPSPPANLPTPNGHTQSGEVTGNYKHDMWNDRVWDAGERERMRRDYLACVSYVDAQIGRVLRALGESGLARSSIVVIWSDHGWHLGDLALMGKHTPYEAALHAPLLVRVPGQPHPGVPSTALVSTVDIAPTLLDLCNVAQASPTDGLPFARALEDPTHPHRTAAPSFWRRGPHIARSVRTETSRTIEWREGWNGPVVSIEHYDLESDPDQTRCHCR